MRDNPSQKTPDLASYSSAIERESVPVFDFVKESLDAGRTSVPPPGNDASVLFGDVQFVSAAEPGDIQIPCADAPGGDAQKDTDDTNAELPEGEEERAAKKADAAEKTGTEKPSQPQRNDLIEFVEKALGPVLAGWLAWYMLNQSPARQTTEPRSVAVVDGRVLPRFGEFFVAADGRIRTQSEVKPDIENVAAIRSDAQGRLYLRVLKEGAQVHIRSTEGDIRTITSGEIELKPGETFSTGNAEFARITSGRLPAYELRLVSNVEGGRPTDLSLRIQDNQTFEIGNGERAGQIERPGMAGRFEMNVPGLSARQARFGMDSKGLFVIEGGTVNGSNEIAPSEKGTYLNGEKLNAGEKRYLRPGDRLTFGEPGARALAKITIEPVGIKEGANAPAHLSGFGSENKLRSIDGTSRGEPFRYTIGTERRIVIGKEGHIDVGGKHLGNKHAEIRVDSKGNAFMRVMPQEGGAPEAVAWIERHGGGNVKLTAQGGWVPIGLRDQISMGGSKFFSIAQRVATPYTVTIDGRRVDLETGKHVWLGRSTEAAPDGADRVALNNPRVSITHAKLGVDERGNLYIEDVGTEGKGSTNGTYVNGRRLKPGERRIIKDTDGVWLGETAKSGSTRIDIRDLISKGDLLLGGRVFGEKPVENPVRMEPRTGVPVRGVDVTPPVETRGSIVVGEAGGRTVRIRGGLGDSLPHETISLSDPDAKALGSQQSQFEKVELTIRGEKVAYYRPKNNPDRFYLLADKGSEGARLVRDYEVYLEPPKGGPSAPVPPRRDGPPERGPGSGGSGRPPAPDRPPIAKPGTEAGGGSSPPAPDRPPIAKSGTEAGGGSGRPPTPDRPPIAKPGTETGGGSSPPTPDRPPIAKPGTETGGGSSPPPAEAELRIETSPFESGPDARPKERPVAAMEQGKIVEIRLPGQVVARVARAELPNYLERVEREVGVDELGKIFDAQAKDTNLPKEERAKWEKLNARWSTLTAEQKAECKADFFAQIRADLGINVDAKPETAAGSRAMKCLGIAGAGLGIAIITGAVLHQLLKSEQSSTSRNRVQVEFKK